MYGSSGISAWCRTRSWLIVCGLAVSVGVPTAAGDGPKKDGAEQPEPVDPDQVTEDEDGKIKIDPELQKRIDELLKRQKNSPGKRRRPNRTRPGAGRPGANRRPGAKRPGADRPGTPKREGRPGRRNVPDERRTPVRPGTRRTPGQDEESPDFAPGESTTSLNIPPSDEMVPPEDRTYRFSIKDGTFEQLVEGFARQTGLGVLGDAPRDGKVTFVTTEELSFDEALARVRMLLFNYKPHEPYWIEREDMNLRVIRVADIYRILPRDRMFQSVEQLRAAKLRDDELALVIFTPQSGSVAGLKLVRDFMPDYVRVTPLEDQNRVTIFALKKDIDKYLGLIDFFEGKGSDPRKMEKIFVKHLLASEAVVKLQELMDLSTEPGTARAARRPRGNRDAAASLDVLPEPEITIVPEDPQGYILVRAMPATIDEIKELLPWIDVEDPIVSDDPVIIPVEYVDPQDLVDMLQQILAADEAATTGSATSTTKSKRSSRARRSRRSRRSTPTTAADLTLMPHPSLDAIIAFGDEAGVRRVRELVAMFDVESQLGPQRIELEHADAETVIAAVETVLGKTEKGKPVPPDFLLTADPVGDALWFTGTERELEQVREMIAALDVAEAKPALRIVDLENALPSFVAGILSQYEGDATAPTRRTRRKRRRGRASAAAKAKQEVTVARFTPDDDAMQLYILCTDDEWLEFEPLIKQLDGISDDEPLYERIDLEHLDGESALEQLTPMVGDAGTEVRWAALEDAIMVIGGDADLMAEVRSFLKEIDRPSDIVQRTFEIQYADPAEIKTAIDALIGPESSGKRRTPKRRARTNAKPVVAIPTVSEGLTIVQLGNRLVVQATPDDLERIEALIAEFDVATDEPELRIFGDFPPGTDMASIAETMRTVMTGNRPVGRRRKPANADAASDPRFIPQPASGKLVVIADPADFEQIEELLDVLRSDVEIDKVEVAYIGLDYADPAEVIDAIEPLLAMQIRQLTATGELAETPDGAGATPAKKRAATRRLSRSPERYFLVPDLRNNRVVIAAPAQIIELAKGMIAQFDTPSDESAEVFRTIVLKNADPASMVQSVQELMGAPAQRRRAKPPTGKPGSPAVSRPHVGPLMVAVAPGGGAVVLNGPKEEVEQAVEWIEHLDEMSTRGRLIKVFSIEHADLSRLVDLVMNVVDTPDATKPASRRKRQPRRPRGRSRDTMEEEEEDPFSPTKTYVGNELYVQADFVARTMLVATTESRMAEVEEIVADFNVPPEEGGGPGIMRSEIPSFVYNLEHRDAFDASWEFEGLLEQLWQPSDEIPQVESALFGNALIIKYPDESRFDEIRELITKYIDRLTDEEQEVKKVSFPVPKGISARELALLLKAKHADYQIDVQDITPPAPDHGIEVLRPFRDSSSGNAPSRCVLPGAIHQAVSAALASTGALQTPPDDEDEPEDPDAEAGDAMERLLEPVLEEQAPPAEAAATDSWDADESPEAPKGPKKKVPKGEKLEIRYDANEGLIFVEGMAIVTDEVDTWIEDIREELKDLTPKPDIRIYRVRYIDVNSAKDILEEMFNATRQQRRLVQQQQRAARQRARQMQQQRRRQQAQQKQQGQQQDQRQGRQGQQQRQQQQQPQVPQLPAESVRIYPHERDRALIIRADTSQYPIIEELLATIDRPKPIDSELKTFKLERLNATDVEELLTELLGLDAETKTRGRRQARRRTARSSAQAISAGPGAQLPQTIMQDVSGGAGRRRGPTRHRPRRYQHLLQRADQLDRRHGAERGHQVHRRHHRAFGKRGHSGPHCEVLRARARLGRRVGDVPRDALRREGFRRQRDDVGSESPRRRAEIGDRLVQLAEFHALRPAQPVDRAGHRGAVHRDRRYRRPLRRARRRDGLGRRRADAHGCGCDGRDPHTALRAAGGADELPRARTERRGRRRRGEVLRR